jgi:hypothetical protein
MLVYTTAYYRLRKYTGALPCLRPRNILLTMELNLGTGSNKSQKTEEKIKENKRD